MIKKVQYNVFDVFFGKGWTNWVRMEFNEGYWKINAGDKKFESGANALLSRKFSNTNLKEPE